MQFPTIIQGGMGTAVSNWRLARSVSEAGELGVIAGTALATVLARRLQLGDPGAHCRHALAHFPVRPVVARILERYFVPGGIPEGKPFRLHTMPGVTVNDDLRDLTVAGCFCEVFLAKEAQPGLVGINLMEKIQFLTLPSLFGAILAGVDVVLMGAGIPRSIPGVLDRLARMEAVELKIDAKQAPAEGLTQTFDPRAFVGDAHVPKLHRPAFFAIISSNALASTLAQKANGRVDGFVVEGSEAGGHNAPPRGPLRLDDAGEPIFGPRDQPDIAKIRELGIPFWMAGGYGRPAMLKQALALGATGVQVGTPFAFSEESGMRDDLKAAVLKRAREGTCRVFTDPKASPTGFPFKVVDLPEILDSENAAPRERICDLGYLRTAFCDASGKPGYRCPAAPLESFVKKGGDPGDTEGRQCVCNGLLATIGLGQRRADGMVEQPMVTAGTDAADLGRYLEAGETSYPAIRVIEAIYERTPAGSAMAVGC